jgi:DNA-dependent protein kinase catalytic subunit
VRYQSLTGYGFGTHFNTLIFSGRLISIDFGHAFGSSTELLPVPEIVPFRLTRQLSGFLEPVGIAGILRVPMINVLEALRNDKNLILNVMDIFVKEPLLDWKKIAIKRGKEQSKVSLCSYEYL